VYILMQRIKREGEERQNRVEWSWKCGERREWKEIGGGGGFVDEREESLETGEMICGLKRVEESEHE